MSEYQPSPPRDDRDPAAHGGPPDRPEREDEPVRPGIWVAADPDSPVGTWWDATGTPERLRERIGGGVIAGSIGFGDFRVRPDEEPEVIARVANGIATHGLAFAFWAHLHDAEEDMLASFEDSFLGEWPTAADWVRSELRRSAAGTSRMIGIDPDQPDLTSLDDIAERLWLEGRIVKAHTDEGTVWIFDAQP